MRRLVKIIAASGILAGGVFGVFVVVEASVATASPSSACLQAQALVQQLSSQLIYEEQLQAHTPPPFNVLLGSDISQTAAALAKDEQTESELCPPAAS